MDFFYEFKRKTFEVFKYASAVCMMIATLLMFSPHLASASVWPWILYLFANTIWLLDSYASRNKPWLLISIGFCVLDAMLIIARL